MNMPAPARDLHAQYAALAEALRPAILRLGRHLRRETLKTGISGSDAHLLAQVGKRPGIGVSELALAEQVSTASMSGQVKRLKAAGWLTEDDGAAEDQRRVRLLLTAEGLKAINAVRRSRTDWLATHVAALSDEDREMLNAAVEALGRLAEMRA